MDNTRPTAGEIQRELDAIKTVGEILHTLDIDQQHRVLKVLGILFETKVPPNPQLTTYGENA